MSAVLVEAKGLYHRWEYTPPGGETVYTIDYRGGEVSTPTVAVDGELVAVDNAKGRAERFLFSLGPYQALLDVRFDLLMKIKYLKFIVDGVTVYTEGEAQAFTSPEELQALHSGPKTPRQVRILKSPEALEIRYRESLFQGVLWLIIALSIVVVSAILFSGGSSSFTLITLALVLLGLFALYLALVKLVNRTTIRLDRQLLTLQRGPLPTRLTKEPDQPVAEIAGFTIGKQVVRHENSRSTVYQIVAKRSDGDLHGFLKDPSLEAIIAIRNALACFQDEQRLAS